MHRRLSAAPKFGHPFASNPELPSLAGSSAAVSSTNAYAGYAHVDKPSPIKGAAVSGSSGGDGGGGISLGGGLGGPRVGPDRPAQHASTRYESRTANEGFTDGNGTARLVASPLKTTLPPTPSPALMHSSVLLEDEEPLFTHEQGRQATYKGPRRRAASGSSRGTAPSNASGKAAQRRTAKNPYRRHHHSRHHRDSNDNSGDHKESREGETRSYSAHSYSKDSGTSADTLITRDSFGYPIYHPVFRQGPLGEYEDADHGGMGSGGGGGGGPRASHPYNNSGGGGGGPPSARPVTIEVPTTTDVPWDLRNMAEKEINSTFAFLSSRYFWFLVEYALRVTCIAMLIPAIIINLDLTYTPFVSTTFALTSVVIAVGTNFGQSCVFFVQYIKGGCIWLPLATICSALKLNKYLGAWFVVYVVLLFLMATFTEKTTRRMCLLLYNISMCSLLSGDESLVFPTRVLADWALGAAFALVATLIPYPMLATRFSAHITKIMFNNTATCFTGILSCFWAPSNTERSMSMVRIRSLVRTLDHLIEKFDSYDAFTFYEVLIYETSERREVRKEKVKLLLNLKMNLRAMERVINMVQEKPQMIDQSERCLLLRDHLSVPMDDISRSMEALLWKLSEAKKYDQLRMLSSYFEATGRAMKRLQNEFDVGRRVLFYEHQEASMLHDGRMEEFVPLMTFFVFSIVNFWTTLEEFESCIDRHKPTNDWKESFKLVWNALIDPFVENAELIRLLCVRRAEPEVRVVIEAAKVSVAMLISVIFFYYVDNQSLLLTGPSIIAFVSGTNPVEAVQAGAARMSGTLIGAVLGFFAASLCHTAVDRVAALCVITFVMTFFRPGQKFGTICMYCNFVAVSGLAPTEQTADLTISRIQQNTFAIFIYCFISVAVFPVSPNHVLFKKRMVVMRSLNATMQKLSSLFNDAARSYIETRSEIRRGAKTEDDVVSIGRLDTISGKGVIRPHASSLVPMQGNMASLNHVNNDSSTLDKLKGGGDHGSDMTSPATRNNSNMIMPGAFTMAPQDTLVDKIFADIFAMMDTMKATSSVMPLAADEFQIIPHEYPLRASGDVHAALYRLCALVYTMTCAWKTMREKGYFTTDMLHILHNLAPIANDIARCIDRFTHVMEFYVRFPSSGLSSELTKGAMQFRALCVELSARKERDLIAVIRHTILMKRIRDDDSSRDEEAGEDDDQEGHGGNGGGGGGDSGGFGGGDHYHSDQNNHHGVGGEGAGDRHVRQRFNLEDWGDSRSGRKHRRRSRDTGHRQGSGLLRGQRRSASGGSGTHRHSPRSRPSSNNDVSGLGERSYSNAKDRLNASQVRSAAPFFNLSGHQEVDGVHPGESVSSQSTFKDSVMPRLDSRDQVQQRFQPPVPNDSTWLPVPRSELPEMPSRNVQQEQDLDSYQHVYEREEDSAAETSPWSRMDGGGTVTNTTCVFDPSVLPPPLDDAQAAAVRRARLEAQLPPSMKVDSTLEFSQGVHAPTTGTEAPHSDNVAVRDTSLHTASVAAPASAIAEPSHRVHSSLHGRQYHAGDDSANPHHSHLHRSSRHPSRLTAQEESPATKKPSALLRADRLRDHLRGFQRQPSGTGLSRQHSSFEMRTFGASYTNIAEMDKSIRLPAHHRASYPRHHTHHSPPHQRAHGRSHSSLYYDDEEEQEQRSADSGAPHHGRNRRGPSGSASASARAGMESALPYGSREGDLALLGSANRCNDTHEPTSLSSSDPHTADGVHRDGPSLAAPPTRSTQNGEPTSTNHHSQDRITLNQSSSDEDDHEEEEEGSRSSSAVSASCSSSNESGRSGRSEWGGSSRSYGSDDSGDETSSLVRFNDSFRTPITVQDAEGLHAFTLSLEMFGKELRRVLYGLEEMLQSI